MNGTTVQRYFVPLAAGMQAVYNGSGLQYYRHSDWLGNSRFAATPTGSMYYDAAYAPFGENYAETGTTDRSFTGQTQDTTPGLYDFLLRQQSSSQGRWLVPDPAGLAAVDLTNPQTWNRYAYVMNNPLSYLDPLGLDCGQPTPQPPDNGGYNVTVTASCPDPPGWFYLAWLGWPGRGSMPSLFCMLMGGCGGSSGSSGSGGGDGGSVPPIPPGPKPPTFNPPKPPANLAPRVCSAPNARVVATKNPAILNNKGAYGIPVGPGTAAGAPEQWGPNVLRNYGEFIWGTVGSGANGQEFHGVVDVIDQRGKLMGKFPESLLIELTTGEDAGISPAVLFMPPEVNCPTNSLEVGRAW